MSANATIGYLARIESSLTQAGTYTTLCVEPTVLELPSVDIDRVESTHLASPNRTRQYVVGLSDPTSIPVETNYVRTEFLTLKGLEGAARWFRISSPDSPALTGTFPGYIHKVTTKFEPASVNKTTFEIQLTGAITVA